MKSKEDIGNTWQILWKGWKTTGEQGECPLLSYDLYYVKKNQGFCTMVMFFPKECLFLSTSFSYPNFLVFSLVFSLGSCPNGPVTCSSYSLRSVTRYMRRGVKSWFLHLNLKTTTVLCNIVTVGGERKHVNARVVELRVALLLREGQTLDKERDIRDVRSDTCVINSGLAQVEPIRGVL